MTRTALAMADDDDGDDDKPGLYVVNEELIERRTRVMYLRNAGATIRQIAAEMGVSETTIRKDLTIVRRDINNEQPTDVIARHRAVIFDIQRANYPAMMRGDKDAASTILKALEREAKLLGLDSPTRILASTSDVEFANEAARLIDNILQIDQNALKELTRGTQSEIIDADPVPEDHADVRADTTDDSSDATPGAERSAGSDGSPDPDHAADQRANELDDDNPDDLAGWSNIS